MTAICCLNPDKLLVGTDSGQLVTYSLNMPVVKNFRSSKKADQIKAWDLGASSVWGDAGTAAVSAPCKREDRGIQFLRLSPEHGAGVVLCGLRGGRVVVFDVRAGWALGITEPHRGMSIGFCPPPAAASIPAAPAATAVAPDEEDVCPAPLTEGEGAMDPYGGGHWGPVVIACCKPSEGGEGELVVLSTSARAVLDACKHPANRNTTRRARRSGLRPGRGWELGEAGGGGFQIEESGGYDLCLPVEVVAATPGQNRVQLSTDARAYLCPRAEERLLRSGLVSSSVMIGKEKHSVEAVSADGTVLVLDRRYRGPAVVVAPPPPRREDARAGVSSSNSGDQTVFNIDDGDDDSELDEPEPTGSDGAGRGSQALSGTGNETTAAVAAEAAGVAAAVGPTGGRTATTDMDSALRQAGATARGRTTATAAAAVAVAAENSTVAAAADSQQQLQENAWDRAWRPSGVRVFAKLRAVFGSGQHSDAEEASTAAPPPPYALYQVVARAGLGVPVTAITSHPRMNFVLVGLADGTVATVLPQGKTEKRVRGRRGASQGVL